MLGMGPGRDGVKSALGFCLTSCSAPSRRTCPEEGAVSESVLCPRKALCPSRTCSEEGAVSESVRPGCSE